MNFRVFVVGLVFIVGSQASFSWGEPPAIETPVFPASDWPWWRGPTGDGQAAEGQSPPVSWGANEGILWKQPIPGRGHASPTVVGDAIYLPIADRDRDVQTVLCLDRETGKPRWETTVHRAGLMKKNEKASQASSTIACDGERLLVSFLNGGAVFTTALSLEGSVLWQKKISDYVLHQGYGASPTIYKHLVIVAADNKGGGAVVALDRRSGEEVWRQARPEKPNYSSPVVLNVAGREQLIMIGCDLVSGFDPLTGEKLWEFPGATTECVITTVTDGNLIYTSGGYPRNHLAAVRGDGSGEVVWETGDRIYVPSILIRDGYLYGILDAGVAGCWRADTGEPKWKSRLGGNFTASPVMLGDRIYATNEAGETVVFRATPARFEKLSGNELADDAFATPVIVGDRIFARMGVREGDQRQEYLYCIGG